MTSPRPGRQGFTLIELLIVIAIIAILASLGTWAGIRAWVKAKESAIAYEVNQLRMAVETFPTGDPKRDYPPDFSDRNYTEKYISTFYRRFGGVNQVMGYPHLYTYMDSTQMTTARLDPGEALIFWLVLVDHSNVQNPFPAGPPGLNAATKQAIAAKSTEAFAFDLDRVVDVDNDGWPEYIPPYAEYQAPYVYFRSNYQPTAMTYTNYSPVNNSASGVAYPYYDSNIGGFVQPAKFQIISAGLDGDYGTYPNPPPMTKKFFPAGTGYQLGDEDNITSFSNGATLGGSRP